jgi:hypothetical protein
MKRALIGLSFSVVGAVLDAGMLISAAVYANQLNAQAPKYSSLFYNPFAISSDSAMFAAGLGIPFLISTALLIFGMVLLFIELFQK